MTILDTALRKFKINQQKMRKSKTLDSMSCRTTVVFDLRIEMVMQLLVTITQLQGDVGSVINNFL